MIAVPITAALGVDKPEVSRLLNVVKVIESEIILAIGPAPKIGRPRWLVFAEKLNESSARRCVRECMGTAAFSERDSNGRFDLLFSALSKNGAESQTAAVSKRGVAWIERTKRGLRLVSDNKAFGLFLESRLPRLLREFEERSVEKGETKIKSKDEKANEIVS